MFKYASKLKQTNHYSVYLLPGWESLLSVYTGTFLHECLVVNKEFILWFTKIFCSECICWKFMTAVYLNKKTIYLKVWLTGSFTSCIVDRHAPNAVRNWQKEAEGDIRSVLFFLELKMSWETDNRTKITLYIWHLSTVKCRYYFTWTHHEMCVEVCEWKTFTFTWVAC